MLCIQPNYISITTNNVYLTLWWFCAVLKKAYCQTRREISPGTRRWSGSFTGELAKKACKVIALDSVESVVKEVCILTLAETVDLILTHALLSKLSDIESHALINLKTISKRATGNTSASLDFTPRREISLGTRRWSGSFTGEQAKKACKVIALDSVESVVKENINGYYENVEFMCADVTSPNLKFPAETVDLILTHALLNNLSDIESHALINLKTISKRATGNTSASLDFTPRSLRNVTCLMSGSSYEFSLVETKSIGASGDNKINENQGCLVADFAVKRVVCWLFLLSKGCLVAVFAVKTGCLVVVFAVDKRVVWLLFLMS
ncbi:phosphomethylethanolamine N-methyltransferase-like protein isoform X2 [Tanacetum coccineum]